MSRGITVEKKCSYRSCHKEDPLHRIRRTPLTGRDHLTDRQRQRLEKYLPVSDPYGERYDCSPDGA